MGNQNTNGNPQVRWSDRTTATSAFQDAPAGMALEHMIQLANLAGADPWFCVPVRADDDYVRNFARMVLTRLDRRRKVYIEYGNEIWNQSFPYIVDGAWMTAEARRIGLPLGPGDDGSDMIYRLRYQVLRSRQIFESFQREMDALGIDRRRLVRVIASQAGYFDRIEQTLDYRFPDGSRAYQHADALGVAPYFAPFASPEQSDLAENRWSADQILDFAECAASLPERAPAFCARIPHDPVAPMMRRDAEIARRRGLRLLGYEGGQHMLAGNGHLPFAEKLKAVNRAPRMKAVYARYLETWRACGGELMFLVNYVQPYGLGYWGMLERQDQPIGEAPKMSAAVEFASRQAPWWKDPWP
jgi:hypothetical protein